MSEAEQPDALRAWLEIRTDIEEAIQGLAEKDLDLRADSESLSIREIVHHLVEANLVASNIILAALAKSGCTYDWSWVTPNASWMRRVGYTSAPILPALETLTALAKYISGLITAHADGFQRHVRLLDAPGAELYTKTVEGLLMQEVEHAEEHLRTVEEIRTAHGR